MKRGKCIVRTTNVRCAAVCVADRSCHRRSLSHAGIGTSAYFNRRGRPEYALIKCGQKALVANGPSWALFPHRALSAEAVARVRKRLLSFNKRCIFFFTFLSYIIRTNSERGNKILSFAVSEKS